MSTSGLSHAAEEVAEHIVHVADTGHGAHASEHPEGYTDGAEHYCFGAVHHCGCCPTAFAAATRSTTLPAHAFHRIARGSPDRGIARDGVRSRVERPPRS